jgi:UDP-N-acetylglucosamine pyrophosphorylase
MNKDLSKIDIKQIPSQIKRFIYKFKKFIVPVFLLLVLSVNGFLIFRINQYSSQEPSIEQLSQQQNAIKRIIVDEQSIDKILKLEKRNIAVKSLFKEARDNPFRD